MVDSDGVEPAGVASGVAEVPSFSIPSGVGGIGADEKVGIQEWRGGGKVEVLRQEGTELFYAEVAVKYI
jgi:hypothetical protein